MSKSGPTANRFSSANSIFQVLAWAENSDPITTARVRRDLGVSDRQARDYLAFLVDLGRLRAVRRGRTDEFHLVRRGEGGIDTLEQAVGAEFAVAALGALKGTAFHDAAMELVSNLRNSLADVQGPRAVRLRNAFYAVPGSVPTNADHAANAETILDAITHGHTLRATYELLGTGEVKYYMLRPLSLVVDHQGLHLLARKRDGQVRMFDVEGFRKIERLRRAIEPSDTTVAEHFTNAFGRYTDFSPETVELRLRGIAARQVRRRKFHHSQQIVEILDDEVVVRYHLGLCPEFKSWLLGMAPDAEVLRPIELRQDIQRRHSEAGRRNSE